MEVVHTHCCGIDIHKDSAVVCIIVPGSNGKTRKEIQTYGTMTNDILKLTDWLSQNGVTHVAMESTGVYWKPIYNLLENNFHLVLVNPQHIKALPGRKTDVKDCEWIADLLRYGLLRGSFVPDKDQRELRELTRYRTSLIEERSAEVNRLQKTLEGANIKLGSLTSDILGVSGRQMLEALLDGKADPAMMADLARGRMREKIPQLEQSLKGQFGPHQRFLVAQQLARIDYLDETIERLNQEIAERIRPFEEIIQRLDGVVGVGRVVAEVIVAEIGVDMSRFPTAGHLASWAGMAPGNNESAGKRKSGRTRKGNNALRQALVQAAHAAGHKKNSQLSAQYHRLSGRLGRKRAAVAVGHSILIIIYHILSEGTEYQDLGGNYYDLRDKAVLQKRLVRRLEALGLKVNVEPAPVAA